MLCPKCCCLGQLLLLSAQSRLLLRKVLRGPVLFCIYACCLSVNKIRVAMIVKVSGKWHALLELIWIASLAAAG